MDIQKQNQSTSEFISLRELLSLLWLKRLLVAGIILTVAVVTTTVGWLMPATYEATATVSPVANSDSATQLGALGSLVSDFGGLASLGGVSLSGDTKKAESIAVLQSESLTQAFITANHLLPVLFSKDWDPATHSWRTGKTPTLWDANRYFEKHIRTVTTDTRTGLVTLTITWRNPVVAARWANGLIRMTNDFLRNQAVAESERNIAYLKEQVSRTNSVELKQAIYSVMEAEIKQEMLARGNRQYALKVIDPAFAPGRPSSLPIIEWLLLGLIGGFALALCVVVVRHRLLSSVDISDHPKSKPRDPSVRTQHS